MLVIQIFIIDVDYLNQLVCIQLVINCQIMLFNKLFYIYFNNFIVLVILYMILNVIFVIVGILFIYCEC